VEIYKALTDSLGSIMPVRCFVIEADAGGFIESPIELSGLTPIDQVTVVELIKTGHPANIDKQVHLSNGSRLLPLHDGRRTVAVLALESSDDTVLSGANGEMVLALVRQVSIALGRMALLRDFQKERFDKERELLRSALLSSVSHDLRTPLASMIGATTSLMELDEALSPGQKIELLESILQESRRLDRYTQNLLDMTRLGHGELQLDRAWIGIDEIIGVVIRRVKPLLKGQQLTITMPDEPPVLYVHAALIEQAIFNVLENAIKFSPQNTVIGISVNTSGEKVVVDIIDHGPGIPVAERERVFDMFHTVSRGDRHTSGGTGLGLAICKGMVGAHGGSVEILDNDTGGCGITVRITLPLETPPKISGDGNV
jgi:two-component system sensor histidine kinase KdpD